MTDTVLPSADETAVAGEQPNEVDAPEQESQKPEGEQAEKPEEEKKPEKTPEQREIDRMRRKIDRLVRQREELRARVPDLRQSPIDGTNRQPQDDSEPVSLSRAELANLVKQEAARLAPTIKQQEAEIEHRTKVVQSLAKTWGQEKFDSLAAELDETFGGLADASGRPKPATDAIFESEDPAAVIEYLADPDNAERAEAIGRMSAIQAGRAIAKIELEIAARKSESKPRASKAPQPVEALRGAGGNPSDRAPTDIRAYMQWANKRYGRA